MLVSQPGIESGPLAVKAQSPNHWTDREASKLGKCVLRVKCYAEGWVHLEDLHVISTV